MIMGLIFPAISYFNSQSFMNASVPWIVLSPVPKKDIIYSNGLNNILKVILIFGLYKLFEVIETQVYAIKQDDYLMSALQTLDFSAQSFMFGFVLLAILVIFLFGILPSYAARMQASRDYKISKNFIKSKKFFYKIVGILFCLFIYTNFQESISYYSANFYIIPLFTVLGLMFFLVATLESVKFYYSVNKIATFGVLLTVVLSGLFYYLAKNDLKNPEVRIDNKLSSLAMIIPFESSVDRLQIKSELIASPLSHKILTRPDLKDIFDLVKGNSETAELSKELLNQCKNRKDHTCRIVTYFKEVSSSTPEHKDLLEEACNKDLGSCMILAGMNDVGIEENKLLNSKIEKFCKNPVDVDRPFCKTYKRHPDRYVKNRTKTKPKS